MIEVIRSDQEGKVVYHIKGTYQVHREDGPAIEWSNGYREWRIKNALHREGGPAIEYEITGLKEWWINGKRHRVDGPAIILPNVKIEWWLNNKQYTREDWFEALTKEQKIKALYSEYFIIGC